MANSSIKPLLLQAKGLSSNEIGMLESLLAKEKSSGLKIIAIDLQICFAGATQKQDIIENLMYVLYMACIGLYRKMKILILLMLVPFFTSLIK